MTLDNKSRASSQTGHTELTPAAYNTYNSMHPPDFPPKPNSSRMCYVLPDWCQSNLQPDIVRLKVNLPSSSGCSSRAGYLSFQTSIFNLRQVNVSAYQKIDGSKLNEVSRSRRFQNRGLQTWNVWEREGSPILRTFRLIMVQIMICPFELIKDFKSFIWYS